MKSRWAKVALHKAVGIYLGDQEIVVSQVAATPLGPVEIGRHREPCADADLASVLPKVLAPFLRRKRRHWPTAVGLPASRFFFGARPMRSASDASPEALLQKALYSPNIRVDDYTIDLIKTELNKLPVASMAACRKKYLTGILALLEQCGIRPVRVEPAPCGLLRVAATQHRAPRRSKRVLRVFLNDTQGLAVLMAADLPLAWRIFELPAGREDTAMVCATRTLQSLAAHYGMERPLEVLMIHGRADLHGQFGEPQFAEATSMRVLCCDEPRLEPEAMAFGLALGCLNQSARAFDVSRTLKPEASFRDIFPWGEFALETALMVCMGLLLLTQSQNLDEAYQAVQAENRRHSCLASTTPAKLEKEKKDLQQKVDVVRRFLDSRVLWSSYTHDIPARLPTNAQLTMFHGLNEMECIGRKREGEIKPKKSLLLRVSAPILANGSMPREIDAFLDSLRGHPLLKRDYPLVELADIKRSQAFTSSEPVANFTVICLPKVKTAPAATAEGDSAGEHSKADK